MHLGKKLHLPSFAWMTEPTKTHVLFGRERTSAVRFFSFGSGSLWALRKYGKEISNKGRS